MMLAFAASLTPVIVQLAANHFRTDRLDGTELADVPRGRGN